MQWFTTTRHYTTTYGHTTITTITSHLHLVATIIATTVQFTIILQVAIFIVTEDSTTITSTNPAAIMVARQATTTIHTWATTRVLTTKTTKEPTAQVHTRFVTNLRYY